MCLLSIAWQTSTDLPFVFIGNRDEYHQRPSAPADWWPDAADVLGGRDLLAGGSWLGISRYGRFAVVTNLPGLPAPEVDALSRGSLVADWLRQAELASADELHSLLGQKSSRYGGFNLLAGSFGHDKRGTLHVFGGGYRGGPLQYEQLTAGVTGLSNTSRNEPWPKLTWLNRELARRVQSGKVDSEELFALLQRRQPVPGHDTAATGVAVQPFVSGTAYGTRCSTVITIDRAGRCRFIERRFGPGGIATGECAFEFALLS